MNRYMGWALKGLALAGLAVICAGIGLVYADTDTHLQGIQPRSSYPTNWGPGNDLQGGSAQFMGWQQDEVVLISNGSITLDGQPFLFVTDWLGGFATDEVYNPRAEIMTTRGGEGQGNAWMKSSGGARVQVHCGGDVVITLGN